MADCDLTTLDEKIEKLMEAIESEVDFLDSLVYAKPYGQVERCIDSIVDKLYQLDTQCHKRALNKPSIASLFH